MTELPHWKTSISALLIAAMLAACGGSNDNDSNSGGPQLGVPGGDSGTLPTQPGAPVVTNNVATDGFNWLNYRRGQLGLPVLKRNALIDVAAQGHSNYQRNNDTITHDQIQGKNGFTGIKLINRLTAAQYDLGQNGFAFGEVISAASSKSGFFMAEELVTAIYHRFVIFEPIFKDGGAGAAATNSNYNYFTADFAARDGFGPGIGVNKIVVYPFDQQTGVQANFLSDQESPDPVPNQNEVGYPISVHSNYDSNVIVQGFTVRARGASSDLPVRTLRHANDSETPESAAAIIPLTKLSASTTYDVTFTGTASGVDVSRKWSFTTK